MQSSRKVAVAITLALAAFVLPAVAQHGTGNSEGEVRLLEDVAGIHHSLSRMADLLESLRRHQEIDLLIRRIELKERRLEPLERRLASAQGSLNGVESEMTRLETMRDQVEEQLREDLDRVGNELEQEGERNMLVQIERELKLLEVEVEKRRQQVILLEDELAEQREDIEDLDAMLLELLD